MTSSSEVERFIDEWIEYWHFWRLHEKFPLAEFASLVDNPTKFDELEEEKKREIDQLLNREALAKIRERIEKRKQVQAQQVQAQQVQAQKDALLQEIHRRFASDFLGADSFFQESCAALIPQETYEQEKISFVKSWVAKNTSSLTTKGEQRVPDDDQAAAIASVNGQVKIVARAGSGKTMTLVNRTLFLLKHCNVDASEVLLLAFNRKAALEMRRRLLALLHEDAESAVAAEIDRRMREANMRKRIDRDMDISAVATVVRQFNITLPHVMTFHALAHAIVHPEENLLYNEEENQSLNRAVQCVIDDHLRRPDFKKQIRELMLAHFREDWERIVEGCYDQSKEEFLRFRRSLPRESLDGKRVKSYGEKIIANFLFEHDIRYKYERNYWWDDINYRPDFTIFKTSKSGVIIEYFGLKGEAGYDEMSEDKRKYWHNNKDWTLIELVPDDITRDGINSFLTSLKSRLKKQGIRCTRLSEDEIWHRVKERAIDRFSKATATFIGRCRQRSLSPSGLRTLIESYSPFSAVEKMFLNFAHRFYVAYLERLSATGKEDFNGLVQRAAKAIETGQTLFKRKSESGDLARLRYICIDEFQDFSDLFYRLLNATRKQNPEIDHFCVGDDWQAINGFTGSDLRFFKNFEEYIGKSRSLYISTNYRSSNAIVAVGNVLMAGLGKPAIAHKKSSGKVLLLDINTFKPSFIEKERHGRDDIITPAVLRLVSKGLKDGLDVVMLSRRNLVNSSDNFYCDFNLIRSFFPKGMQERINISTVHKYKGLEKSMVIVLDADASNYPLIHPDWVFSRVFGESLEKITEEERRLLYVAMTRAIETLVCITDGENKSPFLEDLEHRQPISRIKWTDFPAPPVNRFVVKVGNQETRGVAPTFAVKELLQADGYQWQTADRRGWAKSVPAERFRLETLKAQAWAREADGLEIRVFDDAEILLVAHALIDKGKWRCLVNKLNAPRVSKAEWSRPARA